MNLRSLAVHSIFGFVTVTKARPAPAARNPVFSLGGETPGAVYVFRRDDSGWQPTQKLLPSDTAPEDLFGASLAYDGSTLVVGAPGADAAGADRGAVYVFTDPGSGFAETARIVALSANDGRCRSVVASLVEL
jgi:hypothetical protein